MAEIIEFPVQNGAEDTDELSREELPDSAGTAESGDRRAG